MNSTARQSIPTRIRTICATQLEDMLPEFVQLLRETVNSGVPMGFLAPLAHGDARDYWRSLRPELQAGTRLLLAACDDVGLVGSGQLVLSLRSNSPHRAEVQKLFVAIAHRGRGVGKELMAALHDTALEHGRSLVHLNTRSGSRAEQLYKDLGYRLAGVIPGWTLGPAGERYDHATLYRHL
jgi:GNAT superfamily N-acetyltransferase